MERCSNCRAANSNGDKLCLQCRPRAKEIHSQSRKLTGAITAICLVFFVLVGVYLGVQTLWTKQDLIQGEQDHVHGEQDQTHVWPDGTHYGYGQGFSSKIVVKVLVQAGYITDITIIEENETPNYAAPAFEHIPASIVEQQSLDVDLVAGATASSQGIVEAVRHALGEDEPVDISGLTNGRYMGRGILHERMAVAVYIVDGRIDQIVVLASESHRAAIEELIENVIAAQTVNVDFIPGATLVSINFLDTLQSALQGSPQVELANVPDGTYTGLGEGFYREIEVEVSVSGGSIMAVRVLNHEDTREIAEPVFATLIARIVESQDVYVDVVSGATRSSIGLIEAVAQALDNSLSD